MALYVHCESKIGIIFWKFYAVLLLILASAGSLCRLLILASAGWLCKILVFLSSGSVANSYLSCSITVLVFGSFGLGLRLNYLVFKHNSFYFSITFATFQISVVQKKLLPLI